MKAVYLGLSDDVSAGVYDPTKTSLVGHVKQDTINSNTVFSPPTPVLVDTFTDTGLIGNTVRYTDNGRLFIITAIATGSASILLYNLNSATGAYSYIGKIVANFPNTAATTHTIRYLRVIDNGTTGWRIFVGTTGSVVLNGGTFCINSVDLADFGPVSFTTFPMAHDNLGTGATNMKGVYFFQDPSAMGAVNATTQTGGGILDVVNNHLYAHNGVAATHQYYKYDTSAVLVVDKKQTATVTIATPGVFTANAHGFANNDQVAVYTTGALPTGLTASTASVQTTYFARNVTANTFELSATTGGASINTTGSQSGVHTVMRSNGQTSSPFLLKTGNLPALTGAIVLTNCEDYAEPDHGPALTNGFPCATIFTVSNFYIGRLSELTSLATSWPSLSTINLLGATNEIVAPTVAFGNWSNVLQCFFYVTNTSTFVVKKLINNSILTIFGGVTTEYLEGTTPFASPVGLAAIAGLEVNNGWFFTLGSTVGQRVAVGIDIRSDYNFEYSALYTPVIPNNGSIANFLSTIEEYFDLTSTMVFSFRTGALADAQWATEGAGTWTDVNTAEKLSIGNAEAFQIRVRWDLMNDLSSTPAQLVDLVVGYTPPGELSTNWVASRENSSSDTPAYSAFRLQNYYYEGVVPAMTFTAIDDAGVVIVTAHTDVDSADFDYSPDNGLTWLPLGTIPDVPLTTELRYKWASPPGVRVRVGLMEKV